MSNNNKGLVQATSNGGVDSLLTAFDRLRELEALFLGGPLVSVNEAKCFSTETLLDVLMVLYNECCNSSLRKEKTVSDFIELGKFFIRKNSLTYYYSCETRIQC